MWVYLDHGYTDVSADEDREVELAVLVSGDGDVVDVRLATIGEDGHYRPLPSEVAATIDYEELHFAVLRKLREI